MQALSVRALSQVKKKAYARAIDDFNKLLLLQPDVRPCMFARAPGTALLTCSASNPLCLVNVHVWLVCPWTVGREQDIPSLYNRGLAFEKLECINEVSAGHARVACVLQIVRVVLVILCWWW